MPNFGKYAKFITALIGGAIGWATIVIDSAPGPITSGEWLLGAIALATASGVYAKANT